MSDINTEWTVKDCDECPFSYEDRGAEHCLLADHHPLLTKDGKDLSDTPPDWCPLREHVITIKLEE